MPLDTLLALIQAQGKDVGVVASSVALGIAVILISVLLETKKRRRRSQRSNHHQNENADIPKAPGAIPFVGHALKFKKDAPSFLLQSCNAVGPIFRINLAGKRMVMIAQDCPALRQVANLPESVASSRQAVRAIGFLEGLGSNNVLHGAALQKRVFKNALTSTQQLEAEIPPLANSIDRSLRMELQHSCCDATSQSAPASAVVPSFFLWIRRAMIRCNLERIVGSAFLEHAEEGQCDLISLYIQFQDNLEDAIAKASVLPKWISRPLALWPVQQQRLALAAKIQTILQSIIIENEENSSSSSIAAATAPDNRIGFWLHELLNVQRKPVDEIAEYLIGLLFVTHKNTSIATAQAFLFLQEQSGGDSDNSTWLRCHDEARQFLAAPTLQALEERCPTLKRHCLETLRITAHSIGAVRELTKDIVLDHHDGTSSDFVVRKGETIGIAHTPANLDERMWGKDAAVLDIKSRHDPSLYQDPYKFTTFSHGVHACPGRRLAVTLMQTMLSCLLERWSIEVMNTSPISFERATLAQRERPARVRVDARP